MKFTGHKKRLSDFRIAVFDTHPAVETSLADDPFGRSMRRTEPSRAAIFWTAFLDGPMGGLFGPTEFPYAPQRLFDAPETEAVHDLTTAGAL